MPFSGPDADKFIVTSRFTAAVPAEVPAVSGTGFAIGGNDRVSILDAAGAVVNTLVAPAGPAGSVATVNSVAVANGVLAVAVGYTDDATKERLPGTVVFHDAATLAVLGSVPVGSNPDNIVFTANGLKLLVANEGEPNSYNQATSVDPEGSVSIIDLAGGPGAATVATAGFTAFNAESAALRDAGVRLFGPGATVAQDLEPEYIAISPDGATAYVTLQENNAIAVVDIASATVTDIIALGFKNHSLAGNGFDASDRDGPGNSAAINIANWPVFGMYQPDAIAGFTFNSTFYLATANEGDARDYTGFAEEVRVGSAGYKLDPTIFPDAAALKVNAALGRLTVTNQLGDTNGDGDFDQIYTFGARSFSVWNTAGDLVWDSADAIEQAIALLDPNWAEPTAAQRGTVAGLGDDTRSDNKGLEPEHIAFGTIDGTLFAFVGLERANGIMLFELDTAGATPAFTYSGVFHTQGDIGPEVFTVTTTAGGTTQLLVANEVSGTTTLYEIEAVPEPFTLQLLHASDLEAGLLATSRMGNFAAIVDRLEDEYLNTLTLFSGDNWIPGPFYAAEADPSLEAALEAFYGVNLPAGPQVSGRVSLAFMNAVGTDAASFGNHEFDLGTRAIRDIIAQSGTYPGALFPYLSANLDFSGDTSALGAGNLAGLVVADGQESSAIKGKIAGTSVVTIGGEKIGIIGATTQILRSISSPGAVEVIGDDINDMAQLAAILQPKIDALEAQGINKIVVMSHLQQFALEQALTPLLSGIDIMMSSGNHSLFADADDPLRAGDTPVETYPKLLTNADGDLVLQVNSTAEFAYVNRLVVQFDDQGRIIKDSLDPAVNGVYKTDQAGVEAVYGADIGQAFAAGSKGAKVDALADAVAAVIAAQDGNTFGFTDVFLSGARADVRSQETNLGNLTADANLWYARQTDAAVVISFKNGGGIRDSIGTVGTGAVPEFLPPQANPGAGKEEGEVSQLDITNSLRFNNSLSLLTLSAADVLAVLEHGVRASNGTNTPGQFPQIGGINFSWDITRAAGDRVINATIVDEDGTILDVIARDGELVGDANREFRTVTLNFLAGGGDGYPFPALGTNRVDLLQPGVRAGVATFADEGSEQDALAEFLAANHATAGTAYSQANTTVAFDERNQQLAAREDTVEPVLGFDLWRDAVFDGLAESQWRGKATNLDYTNDAVVGEQMSSAATDSTGAALARFRAGDGDVAVRQVDFGNASVGPNAMTLDWQGRDAVLSLDTAWNSIKTARITEFTGDALTVQNLVMVAIALGPDGDALPDLARDLLIEGAKRADIATGDASDTVVVEVDSNEGNWGNTINVATHGGDDVVEITASSFDWTASFGRSVYNPAWTKSQVDLGTGNDTFLGGGGDDVVKGGAGSDVMDGRGGRDTAVFDGNISGYGIVVTNATTGATRITGTGGTDELVRFEVLQFADATLTFSGGVWA
jgi:YVTN family beta-propeller protein